MSQELFQGAKLKINRANRHIQDLQTGLAAISGPDAYKVTSQFNGEIGAHVLSYERQHPMPPEIALIIGDAIHNLRAALDFMATELVGRCGGNPTNIHFPFQETRDNLADAIAKSEIKRVAPDIADAILDGIQPYKAGNYALWALNKLDNIDKHQLLIPVFSLLGATGIRVLDDGGQPMTFSAMASSTDRIPLVRSHGAFQIQDYGKPTVEVLFDKGQMFEEQPVVPTLHQLSQLVLGILQTFASHCLGIKPLPSG